MKKDTFANRLKIAMELKGIRASDISRKTLISKSLLSKYLAGIAEPGQEKLTALSELLQVNEIWLLGYDFEIDSIEHFLENIDVHDIQKITRKDTDHKLIKYLSFSDIVVYLYSDSMNDWLKLIIRNFKKIENFNLNNLYELYFNDIAKKIINKYTEIIAMYKKCKFLYYVKYYYSKKDFINEIYQRNLFEPPIKNKETKTSEEIKQESLSFIERYLDFLTQRIMEV